MRVFGVKNDAQLFAAKGALAGVAGTLVHDSVMTPCDVVKQRLQLGCYDSIFDCVPQGENSWTFLGGF